MKKLFWLALLLAFIPRAHAGTCPVSSGASWATIKTTITGCASGNTVTLAAGTYTGVNSTVTVPCGVSISGPVLTYSQTHYQTAILQGSGGITQPIHTTAGCSGSPTPTSGWQHISYVEWNGEQASGAGGFIYVTPGTQYLMIDHNWMHGASGGSYPGCCSEVQVIMAGNASSSLTQYVNVTMNEFGPEVAGQDCGTAMTDTSTSSGGGFCSGWASEGQLNYVSVDHNIFHNLEQGAKVAEACVGCGSSPGEGNTQNFTLSYNWLYYIQRIFFETQSNYYDTSHPTLQYIQYNYLGNRNGNASTGIGTGQQNYEFSIANGCGNPPATSNCISHVDYNFDLQTVSNTNVSAGNEHWGSTGSTGNYNLMEGYVAQAGGGFHWAQSGQFTYNNNTFNIVSGSGRSTNCDSPNGGYWNTEDSPAYSPSCSGNTFSSAGTGTYTSAAPTLSPASGSFSGSQVVTIANSGTNRDVNTTDWCTTDGSAPTPGSGTAIGYPNGGSITLTASATVKCVGMWGSLNQPYSDPANYGYVPSSTVSAAYTLSGGGAKTLSSVALSLAASDTSLHVGETNQASVVCTYSDGSTDSCSSYTVTWSSSTTATATISSSGLVTAMAAGTTNLTATANGVTSSAVSLTVASLTSITITSASGTTIHAGSTSQFTATCNYSNGFSDTCNAVDLYDYTASWASSNTAAGTISSAGLFTGVAAGSTNVTATAGGVTSNTVAVTVSSASLSSISLALVGAYTSMQAGGQAQIAATCTYSDSTTGLCNPTSYASSNTSAATVASSGLVTGVAAGTSNLTGTLGGITSSPFALTVIAGTPVYSSGYLATPGSINTVSVGTQLQFSAVCIYTDGASDDCAAIGGVTSWTSTNTAVMTISPLGLATGVGTGTASIAAQVGSNSPNRWDMTVTAAPALSSASLTLFGGVTSIPVGANVQEIVTCAYADGSSDNCTGPADTRGNVASSFTSSSHSAATVSTSGLVTPVAAGSTTLGATVGSFSPTLAITVTGGSAGPTLVSVHQANTGSIHALTLYTNPLIQQHAMCVYSDSTTLDCTFGDARGSSVTAWTAQYSGALFSIGAVGSTTPGIVTPLEAGTSYSTCTVTGNIACDDWYWTIIYPPRTVMQAPGMTFSGVKTR